MTAITEFYIGRRVYHKDHSHKLHSLTLVAKVLQVTKSGIVIVTVSDGTIERIPRTCLEVYPL